MSKLKVTEEERNKPKSMSWRERIKIIKTISNLLQGYEEILLALVHGGFATSQIFRDIDLAIYTGYKIKYDDEPAYIDVLKETIEKTVKMPIDIQLLDYAPPIFKLKALNGILLFEKINGLRAILKHHSREDYASIQALKA